MKKRIIIIIILVLLAVIALVAVLVNLKKGTENEESESKTSESTTEEVSQDEESEQSENTENETTESTDTETSTSNISSTSSDTGTTNNNRTTTNNGTTSQAPNNNNTTSTTQSQANSSQAANQSFADQVVALVNNERTKAGLSPVTTSANQTNAALIRAQEIVGTFSHTRPDGRNFYTVLAESGVSYRGAGENIAYGQTTPEQVMQSWMNSTGHRANILNAQYTVIGVGCYQNSSGVKYWTQLFVY